MYTTRCPPVIAQRTGWSWFTCHLLLKGKHMTVNAMDQESNMGGRGLETNIRKRDAGKGDSQHGKRGEFCQTLHRLRPKWPCDLRWYVFRGVRPQVGVNIVLGLQQMRVSRMCTFEKQNSSPFDLGNISPIRLSGWKSFSTVPQIAFHLQFGIICKFYHSAAAFLAPSWPVLSPVRGSCQVWDFG